MSLNSGDPWYGYAPFAIAAHKYVVAHHPQLGFRVAVRIPDRQGHSELTVFAREPVTQIESQIPDGGPFMVNEWKQVLKPVEGPDGIREVVYLGKFPDLHLTFKFRDQVYDGSNTERLTSGEEWPHHECGIPYRYSLTDRTVSRDVRRTEEFAIIEETETLDDPPDHLLEGLAQARPSDRAGRFYVNEHGAVFTPRTQADHPVMLYAGRIDTQEDTWFEKYTGEGGG